MTSELRNLQGQGQGVRRVRAYVDRVRACHVDPAAPFDLVKESPALALVDAHNAAGTVVAVKAMRLAVQKAKTCGVGIVLVRHSTHFGSASYSAAQALADGCIGVSMTNAGPEMAPWGGIDGVVGTNPWAVAVPTGDGPDAMPIILDMALTTSGKGMMRWLLRDGRKMPTNWAITADGRTTDDPAEAMDGTLLPMGEYKGYGLSLITDVLTGVLSGGAYGVVPYSDQARQEVAHQFIAYDVDWFQPRRSSTRTCTSLSPWSRPAVCGPDLRRFYCRVSWSGGASVRKPPPAFHSIRRYSRTCACWRWNATYLGRFDARTVRRCRHHPHIAQKRAPGACTWGPFLRLMG